MRFLPASCVFLIFSAVCVFSQSQTVQREQGLVTSDPLWRQAVGGAVLSLPHVQAQSAVVALEGGSIKAYSTSGNNLWTYSARGRISPYVSRSREGTCYLSRTNGVFIAVNRTGRELWRRSLDNPLCARVIPGWDGRLFVPTDKKLYCYTASGNLLWTKVLEASFLIAPRLDHSGGIMFALVNNEVHRVDPFGNTHIWTLSNTPSVLLSAEQQQLVVLYADGTMEILGSTDEWYISAQSDVNFLFLPAFPSNPLAAVSIGNNIAAVLNDGRTAFVSLDERRIIWISDSHIAEFIRGGGRPEGEAEMIVDDRGIYVLSRNGATCFSHDGRRLWFTFLQNTAAVPAFGEDGVLYSGGRDWILYAYKIEDRILPQRQSLYGPVPEGSYGTGRPRSVYMEDFPFSEYETRVKLDQIDAAIASGRVGSNELAWMTFLLTVSAGDQLFQYRIHAINLLGKIGSQETIPWLLDIFRRENEPLLKAAAAAAIGAIGVDPDGYALQTFLYHIIRAGGTRDEQVLLALASATGALCRFSGPPLSETGIRILTLLSGGSNPALVKRQANIELSSLR
jgi:outer membrane protein assembly factor BamB